MPAAPPGARLTKETTIEAELALDGSGRTDVSTGLPFLDHMVEQLGKHAGFDLTVHATGDLHVDAHHTVEDVGIVVGALLAEALGDKAGVRRFASVLLPLDEALDRGRPRPVGSAVSGLLLAFVPADARARRPSFRPSAGRGVLARLCHRGQPDPAHPPAEGKNTHHMLEASFKGVARCLRDAVRVEGGGIPSTKGSL